MPRSIAKERKIDGLKSYWGYHCKLLINTVENVFLPQHSKLQIIIRHSYREFEVSLSLEQAVLLQKYLADHIESLVRLRADLAAQDRQRKIEARIRANRA